MLGTINPVAEIDRPGPRGGRRHARRRRAGGAADARRRGALGADFYAWTGHKALGPTGIGVLHGRRELLEAMDPFLTGGDMIASVDFQQTTWNELPFKFEAGTPPIAEAVGLGAAVDYLAELGMERVREHERELTELHAGAPRRGPRVRVVGPRADASAARSSPSPSTACTPTTSPSCSAARACASAPGTTAPSR